MSSVWGFVSDINMIRDDVSKMLLSADCSVVLCLRWPCTATGCHQFSSVVEWHIWAIDPWALGCLKGSVKTDTSTVAREQQDNSMCPWDGWILFFHGIGCKLRNVNFADWTVTMQKCSKDVFKRSHLGYLLVTANDSALPHLHRFPWYTSQNGIRMQKKPKTAETLFLTL